MISCLAALLLLGASSALSIDRENSEPEPKINCNDPFTNVGGYCMNIDLLATGTWDEMQAHCDSMGADLAKFVDANMFDNIVSRITSNGWDRQGYWVGARDEGHEGLWVWQDGTPVKMGTPYWANRGCLNIQAPEGGQSQNCGALDSEFHMFLVDKACTDAFHPICVLRNY